MSSVTVGIARGGRAKGALDRTDREPPFWFGDSLGLKRGQRDPSRTPGRQAVCDRVRETPPLAVSGRIEPCDRVVRDRERDRLGPVTTGPAGIGRSGRVRWALGRTVRIGHRSPNRDRSFCPDFAPCSGSARLLIPALVVEDELYGGRCRPVQCRGRRQVTRHGGPGGLLSMAKGKRTRRTIGRRRAREAPAVDYDSPWKEALDRFFERCLAFFFPQAHAEIDWARGYEMLDKELQPIVRRSEHGRRYVDTLVKVWLKDGEEKWLLIHIEVQAWKEGDFPRRMVVYNHRLFDRYDREVISLAILIDDDPDWRPSRYESGRWGFRTSMEFPIVKLLDYAAKYRELESDPNPFAVVVLAHLKALDTRRSPADRLAWKMRLVKGLYGRRMDPEDVRHLFRFINWVMDLPAPQERVFEEELDAYQREKHMPFIDFVERRGLEKGLLEGIEVVLKMKFGDEGLALMPELHEIQDYELLR